MNGGFAKLTRTDPRDWSALVARLALGIMIFPHGAQKVFGWFGGYGFSATLSHFTEQMGIPWIFALAAILAEFLGGIGLILGLLSRLSALAVGINMLVAVLLVHMQHGFFRPEGFEFHILAVGLAIVVMLRGGGAASVDANIAPRAVR